MKPWGTLLLHFMDTERLIWAGCPLTSAPGAPQALSKGVLGQEPHGGGKKFKKKGTLGNGDVILWFHRQGTVTAEAAKLGQSCLGQKEELFRKDTMA